MKSRRIYIQITALCIAASSTATPSQAGYDRLNAPTADGSPTLNVTSDWLAQTQNDYGGEIWGNTVDYSTVRISNVGIDNTCTFSYTEVGAQQPNVSTWQDIYSVPLGAVTDISSSVSVDPGYSYNGTQINIGTGNIAAIQHLHNDSFHKGSTADYPNAISFMLAMSPAVRSGAELSQTPAQIAPRIVSALQHAVTLCKGTYQPPAQSNQPF